jgi:hypothetical protein
VVKVSGVTLICINVHFEFARGVSSNQKISKDGATRSVYDQTHSITIRNTKVLCVCLAHVNMSLSAYDTFSELNCTGRTNKNTSGSSSNFAAGPHGEVDA